MSKVSKEKRFPIRFLVSEKKHKLLKQKSKDMDISIADYIKLKLFGEENA